ncbi:hypothetical protein ISS04_02190 [Candidatus Woesearchaeota archaeon]|nr:hypothetical protein [Candidatus Woesearchaeota archaeon]
MKNNKHEKHSKFKKTDFFKSWKSCKKIHWVLILDILTILIMIVPLLISSAYIGHYVNSNSAMKNLVSQLEQFKDINVASPENSEIIKSFIFSNKEVIIKLVVMLLSFFVVCLLFANLIFSIMKGVSWSFVKYGELKKKFVFSFFKKSFLWLFIWFFVIFLIATALGGISGIIILQILMLFYFYLTFFVFYPLLVLDYKISFKKLFKKTFSFAMKFRNFIAPFLLSFVAIILSAIVLGLFFGINPILGYVAFLLLLFFYLAFQKYYLLRIIGKVEKKYN